MTTLRSRRIRARFTNWLHPGWGRCKRCNLNWHDAPGHTTTYLRDETGGSGIFAICQQCWQECSIEERIPYYRLLWVDQQRWVSETEQADHIEKWRLIESAVRQGK